MMAVKEFGGPDMGKLPKILQNIGHAFVKIGKFQEAITSYETVMEENPDFQSSFNLIICLYALGDTERMKALYVNMLNIEIPGLSHFQPCTT